MSHRTLRSSNVFALAGLFTAIMLPGPVYACSCIASASQGAATINGLIGAGSSAVVTAVVTGFELTGNTVTASVAKNEKQVVMAIDSMTKRLGTEIRKLPLYQAQVEQNQNELSPARHATDECRYVDRSGDLAAVDHLTGLQQKNLASSTYSYNEMTSNYNEGTDTTKRFMAQTTRLLRDSPDVKTAPMDLVNGPDTFGAMTPEQTQNTFTALNLTLNPDPPARNPNPTTPRALNENTRADLYNLRMAIPQSVSHQILSYEAPVLETASDSWVGETLARINPDSDDAFTNGSANVSKSDLLRLNSTHRTKDPVWLLNLAAKDSQGVMKDLALAKIDHLALEYELWVQDRQMALLTSQLLASQLRQEGNE